jgi:long-chain acyl-CoA synthetase
MTGGSTGLPKRLQRPIVTWEVSAQLEAKVFDLSPSDRFAVLGSPAHSLWAYGQFRAQQVGGAFTGLQSVADRVTVLYGLPELVAALARRLQRSSRTLLDVRRVLLGGGPLPPNVSIEALLGAFPRATFWCFYGAAQTSFIGYAELGMPYRPFPDVDMEIAEDGVIWVKSPMTTTPDDWINTGDVGRWVKPGSSFKVLGRAARQLRIKGRTYVVEPVEQFLAAQLAHPKLALLPDRLGHLCCMWGCDQADSFHLPTIAQVNALIGQIQPGFPLVRRVHFISNPDWPQTPSGKTDWVALQAMASEPPA